MDYIINPMWFYWIGIADTIYNIMIVLSVLSAIALFINLLFMAISYFSAGWTHIGDMEDWDWKNFLLAKKILKFTIPLAVIITLIVIFTPNKETLLSMLTAKLITKENVSFAVDAVKQAVDYIVDAYTKLK